MSHHIALGTDARGNIIRLDNAFRYPGTAGNSERAIDQSSKSGEGQKVPTRQALHEEFQRLVAEKKNAYAGYRQVKKDMQDYLIAKQTVEQLEWQGQHFYIPY